MKNEMKLVYLTKIYWIGLDDPTIMVVYAENIEAVDPIVRDNFNDVDRAEVERIIPLLTDPTIVECVNAHE